MAIPKLSRTKPKSKSPIWLLTITISTIALLYLFSSLLSPTGSNPLQTPILQFNNNNNRIHHSDSEKLLYWGNRIDCPGKHTVSRVKVSVIRSLASVVLLKKQLC
ncbi:hypothetical protein Hanom_Chr05g00428861 [Helianthus anomalus]